MLQFSIKKWKQQKKDQIDETPSLTFSTLSARSLMKFSVEFVIDIVWFPLMYANCAMICFVHSVLPAPDSPLTTIACGFLDDLMCRYAILATWYTCGGFSEALGLWQYSFCSWNQRCDYFNTLRPRQNGRRFADDTFKRIFLNENVRISIKISLKFVPEGPIDNMHWFR